MFLMHLFFELVAVFHIVLYIAKSAPLLTSYDW